MSEQFSIQAKNANGLPITPPQDTRSEEGYMKDLRIEGTIQIEVGGKIINVSGTYRIDDDGITFEGGGYNAAGSSIKWTDGVSVTYGTITAGDIAGDRVISMTGNASGYIRLSVGTVDPDEEQIKIYATYVQIGSGKQLRLVDATDSTSKDTGSIITEGGLGVEKSAHIGNSLHTGGLNLKGIYLVDTSISNTYTVTSHITHVRVEDTGLIGAIITIPAATGSGKILTIKDVSGTAASSTITVNRSGSDLIDGATSQFISTNRGVMRFIDGASGRWDII